MLSLLCCYLHAKNLRHWLFSSRDTDDQRDQFFTWKCPQDYQKGPLESLDKISCSWTCLDTPHQKQSTDMLLTFLGESKMIHCLQRYWWSLKNPAIWTFQPCTGKQRTTMYFILNYFQKKYNDKFLWKVKKLYVALGPFWVLSKNLWTSRNFSGKLISVTFFYF